MQSFLLDLQANPSLLGEQFGEFDAAFGGWTLDGEPYTTAPGNDFFWFRSRTQPSARSPSTSSSQAKGSFEASTLAPFFPPVAQLAPSMTARTAATTICTFNRAP